MDTKALRSLTYGVYIVGVKNGDGFGGCVVDALAQFSGGGSPVAVLGIMRENYTGELIKKYGELTVSVLPEDIAPLTVAIFGFQSARDSEKWPFVEYGIHGGLPVLSGAVSYLRLRVAESSELETHTMFICEVTDAWTGDTSKAPLVYNNYHGALRLASKTAFDAFRSGAKARHACTVCGYIYSGGTPFEMLSADWRCPVCAAGPEKFEKRG